MFKKNCLKNFVYSKISSLFYRFGLTKLFYSRKGLKFINPIYGCPKTKSTSPFFIDPNELFLDPDYLLDEYTLLDTPIIESPHYGLMKAIAENQDISKTDYAKRFVSGTLDGRIAGCLNKKFLTYMCNSYEKRVDEIKSGTYPPVITYVKDGKRYIFDGKHRAALCAYMEKNVLCIDAEYAGLADGYTKWKYTMIKKRKSIFKKTIDFLEKNESSLP